MAEDGDRRAFQNGRGIGTRRRGIAFVIEDQQFGGVTIDAARGVDVAEVDLSHRQCLIPDGGHRAGQRAGEGQDHGRGLFARMGAEPAEGGQQQDPDQTGDPNDGFAE